MPDLTNLQQTIIGERLRLARLSAGEASSAAGISSAPAGAVAARVCFAGGWWADGRIRFGEPVEPERFIGHFGKLPHTANRPFGVSGRIRKALTGGAPSAVVRMCAQ